VGTKRQAAEPITAAAKRSAQYYVNARWLGGMLTNWKTISRSIQRLRELDSLLEGEAQGLTKKELLTLTRERDKLERALGGIKDMGGVPDLIFVIDTNKEAIAIQEAVRLNIPVAAIVDSNCDPDHITLPIPGNDDAGRAITLYCDLVAKAALDGISKAQGAAGVDLGAQEEPKEPAVIEVLATNGAGEAPAEVDVAAAEPVETDAKAEAATAAPAEVATAALAEEATPAAPTEEAEEEEAAKPLFEAPPGEPDDLKKIAGIGPALERRLHELGVTKIEQVANFTDEDIENVDIVLNFKGRIQRDDWVGQARALMSETA
jgi:small subunit ribosomal protein S2